MLLDHAFAIDGIETNRKEHNSTDVIFHKVKELALKGDINSQIAIGNAYYSGNAEVEKDRKESFKWFLKAANQGSSIAGNRLGHMLLPGDGVQQNKDKSVEWFKKSAILGFADSEYMMGQMYFSGITVDVDFDKAAKWFDKAAKQHYPKAQSLLGSMYSNGTGVAKNYKKAAVLYQQSAEKGDENAQYNLGLAYWYGEGVPKSYIQAYKWLNISSVTMSEDYKMVEYVQVSIDKLEKIMSPQQIEKAQQLSSDWIRQHNTYQ